MNLIKEEKQLEIITKDKPHALLDAEDMTGADKPHALWNGDDYYDDVNITDGEW